MLLKVISVSLLLGCLQAPTILCAAQPGGSAAELATLNQQVVAAYQQKRYDQALSLATSALRVSEESFGSASQITIRWLDTVGGLCMTTHDYQRAVSIYQQAAKAREKVFGPDSEEVVINLNSLASAHAALGNLAQAESAYRKMLQISDNTLGAHSRYAALSALRLAEFYANAGRYADAGSFYKRALTIFEKTSGPEHLETLSVMNGLAEAYRNIGDYAKAEPLYRRALGIAEKKPEAGPQTASLLSGLGAFFFDTRDYAQAESYMLRALKLQEQLFGPEHRETASGLNNLAALYSTMGAYKKAEPLCERALKITEGIFGHDRMETLNARQNLARIYMQRRRTAEAEELFRQVLKANERLLGLEHPATSTALECLAILHHQRRDFTNAETLYRRAMESDARIFGWSHRQTLTACANLCCLLQDMGKDAEALALANKAASGQVEEFANILSFAAEKQRLAYQATCHPYALFGSLRVAPQMALAILQNKCVVLDSLLEDRRVAETSTNANTRSIIQRIETAKQELSRLSGFGPARAVATAPQAQTQARRKWADEIEQLEGQLARHVTGLGNARRALRVTVDQVQNALSTNAALVEFVRYSHYRGFRQAEYHYGAVVVTRRGEPQWVCLGSAQEIDKYIALYQRAVRSDGLNGADEAALKLALRGLYQEVWAPIERLFPAETKTVVVSPDDALNFVSFATLLTPNDLFLAQKYSIRYVTSGRDLLRRVQTQPSQRMVVFAAPAYSASGTRQQSSGMYLDPLPELATNAAALVIKAKKWNWPVDVYLAADAAEKQLRAIRSPRILHFSTHGFFLPTVIGTVDRSPGADPFSGESDAAGVVLMNPMRRSGVAFANAQDTLDAWERGHVPPPDDDGILTAEEIGGLRLDGTWLVTLAACDTGVGTAVAGDGVMGLRRGFVQAGVQNLLMTLWPVAVETDDLLLDFYSAVHQCGNAPEALADVQRNWLDKIRRQQGLLPAVFFAGPFILNSQGPVP
jgi:CHAT domain-containing protein/Tfp pilus assembly protein PilF